jgi:hypothetical protein
LTQNWEGDTRSGGKNVGPSGVRALPMAAGINEGGHYIRYFGPSRVHALPFAAGINEGGHYFRYINLLYLLPPLFKTTEGAIVGFQIFAWAPKENNKNSGKKIKFGRIFRFF